MEAGLKREPASPARVNRWIRMPGTFSGRGHVDGKARIRWQRVGARELPGRAALGRNVR